MPVGAPPQSYGPKGAAGRAAITLELVGLDSAAPKSDR